MAQDMGTTPAIMSRLNLLGQFALLMESSEDPHRIPFPRVRNMLLDFFEEQETNEMEVDAGVEDLVTGPAGEQKGEGEIVAAEVTGEGVGVGVTTGDIAAGNDAGDIAAGNDEGDIAAGND